MPQGMEVGEMISVRAFGRVGDSSGIRSTLSMLLPSQPKCQATPAHRRAGPSSSPAMLPRPRLAVAARQASCFSCKRRAPSLWAGRHGASKDSAQELPVRPLGSLYRMPLDTGNAGQRPSRPLNTFLTLECRLKNAAEFIGRKGTGGHGGRLLQGLCRRANPADHRLLEFDPATGDFKRNHQHPLTGDLFVFDETSMVRTVQVEEWRGGLGEALRVAGPFGCRCPSIPPCSVSTPRSSNRTCGFAASGSPTGFAKPAHGPACLPDPSPAPSSFRGSPNR